MAEMRTETNITRRWESGLDHSPESRRIFLGLDRIDFCLGGDFFGFKSGGDGDNGEHLMYLLDIYFDAKANGELRELTAKLDKIHPVPNGELT